MLKKIKEFTLLELKPVPEKYSMGYTYSNRRMCPETFEVINCENIIIEFLQDGYDKIYGIKTFNSATGKYVVYNVSHSQL